MSLTPGSFLYQKLERKIPKETNEETKDYFSLIPNFNQHKPIHPPTAFMVLDERKEKTGEVKRWLGG